MSRKIKVLVFAGSLRDGSYNKMLAKTVADIAENAGAEVTYLDLKDIPLPIFDEDIESKEGLPENGRKFKDLLIAHDAFIISTPEYNGYFPGVLKNAIDWASRPVEGVPPLECFKDKKALLFAASPGGLGGIRSLPHLRILLNNLKVVVHPDQFGLASAYKEFDENGQLTDIKKQENIKAMVENFLKFITCLDS